jgi:hypothetical protein
LVSWLINGSTAGLVDYTLVYSTSDVFDNTVTTTETNLTNTTFTITNLDPGSTYFWKVTANYAQGSATSNPVYSFYVDPGSSSVQPKIGGPHNVSIATVTPTLSWVLPTQSTSQLSYELEVSENSDFTNSRVIEGISQPFQNVDGLEKGKEYYWRVRSSTESGDVSYYSNLGNFKIGDNVTDVSETGIIPTEFEVSQNYPNPFNPSTVISYSIPNAEFVSIRVYNMLGQEIATLLNDEVNAGVYNVTWNGMNEFGVKVATGTYIYRVVAGNNVMSKKMILLK